MANVYTKMKDSGIKSVGLIPDNWSVCCVKNVFNLKKAKARTQNPIVLSLARNGVKIRNISKNEGQLAESYEDYNPVEPGDLLLNPMDLYSGANCSLSYVSGVISPAYFNLKTKPNNVAKYYDYFFKTQYWSMALFAHGCGVSFDNRWTLNRSTLLNYHIPYPQFNEQQAIADYLDKKCANIDEIIEQSKATIEEYKSWKKSVIFEAVTKGLDKNAEMKDSGVEWIGKVPRHWKICKLKYLCSMQAGKNISSELIQDRGEYPVYGGNGLRGYYSNFNMEQDCILVGRQGALCGNVHIVSGKYWATEHAVITQVTNIENLQHLYYLLIGMNLNQYASDAAAQPGLAVGAIKDIYVPLTPKSEQEAIITALDEKCAFIDGIIAEKEALIADMKAYKKSLIFECVTGKRKVF